jgi:hypothetical protein
MAGRKTYPADEVTNQIYAAYYDRYLGYNLLLQSTISRSRSRSHLVLRISGMVVSTPFGTAAANVIP